MVFERPRTSAHLANHLSAMRPFGRPAGRSRRGWRKVAVGVGIGLCFAAAGLGVAGGQPGSGKPSDVPPAKTPEPKGDATKPAPGEPAVPPLPPDAIARFGMPFPRQASPIRFCGFTRDGRSLVTAGEDGVFVWDPGTGAELRRIPAAVAGNVRAADLSRDGTRLATLSVTDDGAERFLVARVFDPGTGRRVGEMAVPRRPPGDAKVCISPDGKKLAYSCCSEPGIAVYDVESGARLLAWNAAKKRVWDVAFLPDGRHLISGGDDQMIRTWDVATGKLAREIGGDLGEIGRIAVSAGGDKLATISQHEVDPVSHLWRGDDFIRLWDAKTGKVLRHLRVPSGTSHPSFPVGLNSLTFTPDGRRLLAGGVDRATRVWDASTGDELRRFPELAGSPGLLAVSPDGNRLAVVTATAVPIPWAVALPKGAFRQPVSADKVLSATSECFHLRDLETGRDPEPLRPAGAVVLSALSPDGRLAATASPGPEIRVWDVATGRKVRELVGHEQEVAALAWVDGGRTLLSAGTDRTVRAWDGATGKEVRKVAARGNVKIDWKSGPRGRAEFSPDGKLLAVVDEDGGVVITDTATGKEAHSLGVRSGAANHLYFSPAGGTLLISTTESLVYSWDTREGLELRSCEVRDPGLAPYLLFDPPADAVLSPDGKILVLNRVDGTLIMVETSTERVLRLLQRGNQGPTRLAMSPDGHTLAWGGGTRDPSIILYEMATGRGRQRLSGHADRVLSLSFSADGRRLLSGSADGTALVWDLSGRARAAEEVVLPRGDLDAFWADLADDDPQRAYRAVRSLAGSPKSSVPFLQKMFTPADHVDEGRVSRLISELASDEAAKHEKAAGELDEIGEAALAQVRKALDGRPPAEAQRRLRQLLEWNFRDSTAPSPARLREVRAVEALQLAGTPEAWKVVEDVARGEATARRTHLAKAALATRPGRGR